MNTVNYIAVLDDYNKTVAEMSRANRRAKESGSPLPYANPAEEALRKRLSNGEEEMRLITLNPSELRLVADVQRTEQLMHEINAKATKSGRSKPFSNPSWDAGEMKLIKRPDGSILRKDRQVKCHPDFDLDGHCHSVNASMDTPSDRMMGEKFEMTDDETRLFALGHDICSVEMKELFS